MFEKIRKMKNQKGFTLVELIVVLVILAILAAMLVPALTGYIDKANNEKIIATTRQVVMAAQTEVSEAYASNTLNAGIITISTTAGANDKEQGTDGAATATNCVVKGADIVKLAEVGELPATGNYTLKNGITNIVIKYDAKGHVTEVELKQGTKTCIYIEGGVTADDTKYSYTSGNYAIKK